MGPGRVSASRRLDAHQPLQGVQPAARLPPFVFAVPREAGVEVLGGAPAVRVAEPRQDRARAGQTERLDQLAAQQPQRHGVQQQHAFVGEAEDAALRVDVQQFLEIEVVGAHEKDLSK